MCFVSQAYFLNFDRPSLLSNKELGESVLRLFLQYHEMLNLAKITENLLIIP